MAAAVASTELSPSSLPAAASARSEEDRVCSCAPVVFNFKLDFDATCPPIPPPFPPNGFFGSGVKDYTCTISADQAQGRGGMPVVVDSIQFMEVDTQFNVINQDPKYVRDVEFFDGDLFQYDSIGLSTSAGASSSAPPGGFCLVVRGKNKLDERIRNVFTMTYTNDCNVQTFRAGDAIGWVVFKNSIPAREATCDAVKPTSSPTASSSARALPPTEVPTPSTIGEPTTPVSPIAESTVSHAPSSSTTGTTTKSPTTQPAFPMAGFPTTPRPTPKPTSRPTEEPTKTPVGKPSSIPASAVPPRTTRGPTTAMSIDFGFGEGESGEQCSKSGKRSSKSGKYRKYSYRSKKAKRLLEAYADGDADIAAYNGAAGRGAVGGHRFGSGRERRRAPSTGSQLGLAR